MLVCKMCQFSRSVSDHGIFGIKLNLSPVEFHSYVVLLVSLVAMTMGAKNLFSNVHIE